MSNSNIFICLTSIITKIYKNHKSRYISDFEEIDFYVIVFLNFLVTFLLTSFSLDFLLLLEF